MSVAATAETPPIAAATPRILSVDALRGFDMFWIIGGEHLARAFEKFGGGSLSKTLSTQLSHTEWQGCHFFDVIFPLFLFLVGVSIVLSIDRMKVTLSRTALIRRILTRGALMFALGIFYYGGLTRSWPDVALSGVLHRIALCYVCAALLYAFLPRKALAAVTLVLLIGYCALLTFVPFPDVNLAHVTLGKKASQTEMRLPAALFSESTPQIRGAYDEGRNLVHYIDARWLPGRKRNLNYTNEGLLSTLPAVVSTLLGIWAGCMLTSAAAPRCKILHLFGAGVLYVALGLLCSVQCPVIKRIWTPSFTLLASGYSMLALGVFYWLVDVRGWQRWCTPFLWIGANALTVYLVVNIVDFEALAARFVGGDVTMLLNEHLAAGSGILLQAIVELLLPTGLTYFLYKRKVFIRL